MRIYIKEIRDGSSEVTLITDVENELDLIMWKMVMRAFQTEEQLMQKPCGRKVMASERSQWESRGESWKEQICKTEKINKDWPCRAFQAF